MQEEYQVNKQKRRPKYRRTIDYPDIAIGIMLILGGIYIQSNTDEYSKLVKYSPWLILIGLFFSVLRLSVTIMLRRSKRGKLLSATIYKIAEMDGVMFEDCCLEHFKKLGYTALPTATSGDYGADIVLKKHGEIIVVQCKRYRGKVGIAAVQEVIGAKGYYKANKAMVITNSYYTPNAIFLAKANEVELWDRDDMVKNFKIHT